MIFLRPTLATLLATALACSAVACGSSARGGTSRSDSDRSHIAVVVFENREYAQVVGNPAAPYLNSLARHYALARRYYAITHPSLPNYLALIGGSTFGVHSNCASCTVRARSLVDQLEAAHFSWKAYMEDMPRPCYRGRSAGGYVKRHDPFLHFHGIASNRRRCANVVPYGRLAVDLRRDRLPRFVWITPNLCHATHGCGLSAGDRFLALLVPALLRRLGPRGALFVLWDEGTTGRGCCRKAAGGRIAAIVAGPAARRGHTSRFRVDHYSTLRTIEDAFGLPHLRAARCSCSHSLRALFRKPPRVTRPG